MKLTKKGFSLTEVPQLVIVFMVIALVLGVGATVLINIQESQCTYGFSETYGCLNSTGGSGGSKGTTLASNITGQGITSQKSLAGWQGTWVVIVAAAVILGIIYKYMIMG
jgi:hypothetical protein